MPGGGEAAGHRHHVRLGRAAVEEALRELLAELHRLGRDREVGVEGDDVLVRLAELDQGVAVGLAGGGGLGDRAHQASSPWSALVCASSLASSSSSASVACSGRRRLAVEAEAALHRGDAAPLLRLSDDRRRPVQGAAALERLDDRAHVVAVDLDRVPAEGLELGADVAGVHDLLGGAVGLEVVVVDDRGEVGDAEVRRRRRRLPGLPLLDVAVGEDPEDVGGVVEAVEAEREGDAQAHRQPLTERAGGDLDALGLVHVGWPWSCAPIWRRPMRSSSGKYPLCASAAYWIGAAWPLQSTKRSRSGQSGRSGSWRRTR